MFLAGTAEHGRLRQIMRTQLCHNLHCVLRSFKHALHVFLCLNWHFLFDRYSFCIMRLLSTARTRLMLARLNMVVFARLLSPSCATNCIVFTGRSSIPRMCSSLHHVPRLSLATDTSATRISSDSAWHCMIQTQRLRHFSC